MCAPKLRWVALGIALALIASACGSFGPPESCGVGGTADEAKFSQYFAQMELVDATTGQPGPVDPESGPQFAATAKLEIRAKSKAPVALRACVQSRRGGGKIPFDQTQSLPLGPGSLSLGSFAPGSYVVRVVVDGVLVRNLTFMVE